MPRSLIALIGCVAACLLSATAGAQSTEGGTPAQPSATPAAPGTTTTSSTIGTTASRYSVTGRASMARRASRAVTPPPGTVTLTVRRRALFTGVGAGALLLALLVAWYALTRGGGVPGLTGLDPKKVAVLYFADESSDQRLSYVASGFTEALISELGQVQGLTDFLIGAIRGGNGAPKRANESRSSGPCPARHGSPVAMRGRSGHRRACPCRFFAELPPGPLSPARSFGQGKIFGSTYRAGAAVRAPATW